MERDLFTTPSHTENALRLKESIREFFRQPLTSKEELVGLTHYCEKAKEKAASRQTAISGLVNDFDLLGLTLKAKLDKN